MGIDPTKNAEKYTDRTAYEAIKNADAELARVNKLLHMIFDLCKLSGFHIEERIVLRDNRTGKVWR